MPGPEEDARHPSDPAATPAAECEAREAHELVSQCLDAMPGEYRRLILLRDFAGHTWPSIARETGRPSASAARMMYHSAYDDLSRRVRARVPR